MPNANINFNNIELLAPAGDLESLESAIYFGADAVYFAHKNFGMRANANNFDDDALKYAIDYCHAHNKKAYITCNIVIKNSDINELIEYLKLLEQLKPDAIILCDPSVLLLAKQHAPSIALHLSTQANTCNSLSANFWAGQGIERIVVARELSLTEIKSIKDSLPPYVELEAFVHGAMCVAYSGRCLISSFVSGRSANRGACAQHCRYEYEIREKGYDENAGFLTLAQNSQSAYVLNSKDLNSIAFLDKLVDSGITSFKIEGRAKAAYYVANVVNVYRRAIDLLKKGNTQDVPQELQDELFKSAHRQYFSGFYFGDAKDSQYLLASRPESEYQFVAKVVGHSGDKTQIQVRNKFEKNEILEVLSPTDNNNKTFKVGAMFNSKGLLIDTANKVKEVIELDLSLKLCVGDMLRKKA